MVAKQQFKVTLPEELVNLVDYYRQRGREVPLSRAEFTERSLTAYIKFLNGDYSGSDRVISLLNQLIEETKIQQELTEVNTKVTIEGFDVLHNLNNDSSEKLD